MLEVRFQIGSRHLNRRNPMGIQQIEKLPAIYSEETGRLALRDPALLEPMHDSSLP
jgi:hypothetical protein